MTLTLSIPPEIEQHLDRKAREQGLSTEAYALKLLSESISVQEKSTKLVNLLQSWIDEDDVQEQQETGEYLIQALDEDRLSDRVASVYRNRKLFPSELKGITW
jgi:site-specific recombinase